MENDNPIIHMEARVSAINGPEGDHNAEYPYELVMTSGIGNRVKVYVTAKDLSKMLRPRKMHSMHLKQAYPKGVNLNQYVLIKLL